MKICRKKELHLEISARRNSGTPKKQRKKEEKARTNLDRRSVNGLEHKISNSHEMFARWRSESNLLKTYYVEFGFQAEFTKFGDIAAPERFRRIWI
jgi:hypothetical protein